MAFKWLRQKQEHSKTPPFDILGGLSTHKKTNPCQSPFTKLVMMGSKKNVNRKGRSLEKFDLKMGSRGFRDSIV